MLEDLAWEVFRLTGNIEEYLLYKGVEPSATKTGEGQNSCSGAGNEEREAVWS